MEKETSKHRYPRLSMAIPAKLQKLLDDADLVAAHGHRIWSVDRIHERNHELRRRYGWPSDWLAFASDDSVTYFVDLRDDRAPVYQVPDAVDWSSPERSGNDPEDFALRMLAKQLDRGKIKVDPYMHARVRAHTAEPLESGPPPDMEFLHESSRSRYVPDMAFRRVAVFLINALGVVFIIAAVLAGYRLIHGSRWFSLAYMAAAAAALYCGDAISKAHYIDEDSEDR